MRRSLQYPAIVIAGVLAAACSNTPTQPSVAQPSAAGLDALAASAGNGKPEIDPTWANGKTVYMIGPRLIPDAKDTQPNLYARADELYLVVFPQATLPQPGAGPITLASGYQPQCNPCFHPLLPFQFVYHDHVITGAPGTGKNGTAGEFEAPWKVILMMYDPTYANSTGFKPVTSEAEIDAAEAKGGIFVPLAPGAPNPFEIETGNVLICPIASNKS
jgi:hypothetical protein